ncbi:MAG: DUF2911 domain-containing protein [Bacteroidota bacterium]
MKIFTVLAVALLVVAGLVSAQTPPSRTLRVSPFASVSQTVGTTEVGITYHRPGVKGREIWNKLVPFGQVWRAGANNATMFTFSDDVQVAGTTLKAGRYEFFVVPNADSWTVIFNSATDQWGAYSYDSTKNVTTFTIKPEAAPHEEWLSYNFSDLTVNSAKVTLRWEKISASFVISTNTMANIAKSESDLTAQAAQQAAVIARWSLDNKADYERGMQAADRALALGPVLGNYSLKAQLLAQQDKFADAVKTGELGLEAGKKAGANTAGLEKMIAEWKEKLPKGKKK